MGKMSSGDVQMVADLVKGNHYQLACRSYFSFQHREVMKRKNVKIDDVQSQWSHPNEYYDHSYELYHGKKETSGKDEEKEDVEMTDGGNKENTNNTNNGNSNSTPNGMNIDTPQ